MLALLKISGRIVWSALLSTPFALIITSVVDIFTNQLNVRIDWLEKYEGWVGLAAFFASLSVCTLWVFRTDNRHLAISRGCGVFAAAVFALIGVALVDQILKPPPLDPMFPPFWVMTFFAMIGISIGILAGIIAWDYSKRGRSHLR